MKGLIGRPLLPKRCLNLRQLSSHISRVKNRKRMVSVLLVLLLLIGVLPPAPRSNSAHAKQSHATTGALRQTSWFSGFPSSSFFSLAGWLAEKLRRKSPAPTHVAAPPVTSYFNPLPVFLDAPTNLSVTAVSGSPAASINLSWTAPAGSVDHYQVERSQHVSGPFLLQGTSAGTTYADSSVTAGNAYLYRVRAIGSGGIFSTPSNMALGTAFSFEFSQLQGQPIKAQHIYDLRTTVNAVRSVANVSAASWALSSLSGVLVQATVVQELRNKLDEALQALSISAGGYTDPTLATGPMERLSRRSTSSNCRRGQPAGAAAAQGPSIRTPQRPLWIR